MALSVSQGFDIFLERLTPLQSERDAKAWKYFNAVPVSSFYLEMRAAQYMEVQTSLRSLAYLCGYFEWLDKIQLADMNDPKGKASRFSVCSGAAPRTSTLSNLHTAATRARKAVDAEQAGSTYSAFEYLNLLFNGQFPRR
ncbi:hypothetical protein [Streptomyces sp. NPDC059398]|uniref:hypothetical protein n=1 Tax=Streptomyces sp. NPDC059398 TaxID=3346820 RepID=UPI0036A57648